jgi:hypothetical protein
MPRHVVTRYYSRIAGDNQSKWAYVPRAKSHDDETDRKVVVVVVATDTPPTTSSNNKQL